MQIFILFVKKTYKNFIFNLNPEKYYRTPEALCKFLFCLSKTLIKISYLIFKSEKIPLAFFLWISVQLFGPQAGGYAFGNFFGHLFNFLDFELELKKDINSKGRNIEKTQEFGKKKKLKLIVICSLTYRRRYCKRKQISWNGSFQYVKKKRSRKILHYNRP